MAAILNFSFFGGKLWRDFVVPAIIVSRVVRSTILQISMLLSGSAHLIHISAPLGARPKDSYFPLGDYHRPELKDTEAEHEESKIRFFVEKHRKHLWVNK